MGERVMGWRIAGWLLLVLLTAGLAIASPAAEEPPEALLERGLHAWRGARAAEAQTDLSRFLAVAPQHPRRSEAWLALGQLALERGEAEEALLYCRLIVTEQRTPAVVLLEGAALIAAGQAAAGVALLQRVPQESLSLAEQGRWLLALADGQNRLGHPLEALVLYQQASNLPLPGETRELISTRAHTLLRDRLDDLALAEAGYMLRGSAIGLDARLQQAQRAAHAGASDAARDAVEEVLASRLPFRYRDEALLLRDRLAGKAWLRRSVGVVLPLSGRYAPYGTLVRRGIELAVAEHNSVRPNIEFIFRDVSPDGEENARAVARLANEERVMAVIGPLTGSAAVAAARQAAEEKLPLLTLSQKPPAEAGNYVFHNGLTAHQQVRTLVRHALNVKGLKRFAMLYPDDRLGREMAEAFAAEVAALGGTLVARQSYAEGTTDFRRQVKLLLGEDPNRPDSEEGERALGSLRAPRRKGPPPPFEALFLPNDAQQMALIAPQLTFYGVEGVQLLGSNGWNSPELIKGAGRFIDGAIFVDGFFAASPAPAVRQFIGRYRERYRDLPTILEAQGYDVAGILLTLLDRAEVRTRDDLRLALGHFGGYPGVTGTTTFNPVNGEAEKDLYLLQVAAGEIRQLP